MPRTRTVILVSLLLLGVQLWLITDFWLVRSLPRVLMYLGAIGLCFVPIVQRAVARLGRVLQTRSRLGTVGLFFAISAGSAAMLYATALYGDRQFTPVLHDEYSYLLQARMIASGHLSMPAHPLGAFFDTFYVITDRAYASQYFPGAAMLFAVGLKLGWAPWVVSLLLTGACSGLTFLVLRELVRAPAALSAVIVLLGVLEFRVLSIGLMSQIPALLFGLLFLFALLRWDDRRSLAWIVLAGAAIGWLAITRPMEGAVFGLVGAAFVLFRLRHDLGKSLPSVAFAGLVPMLPFLAIQLKLNHDVTGEWLKTPFTYYAERDMPGTALGFHPFDPATRPVSRLPQKQAFYDSQVVWRTKAHTIGESIRSFGPDRLWPATRESYPDMLLLIVVPVAMLSARGARRWLVLGIVPVWFVAYSLHVFFYSQYYIVWSMSALLLVCLGFESIERLPRMRQAARVAALIMPILISVLVWPQFKRDVRDQWNPFPSELAFQKAIRTIPEKRSIVLVKYAEGEAEHELVYNTDVAWPDDAPVIRAHDLGDDRNQTLYRYYAGSQPDRTVYRFDRADGSLKRLGDVRTLAGLQ